LILFFFTHFKVIKKFAAYIKITANVLSQCAWR